jgi:multidrug efflux pump subunit AcrB
VPDTLKPKQAAITSVPPVEPDLAARHGFTNSIIHTFLHSNLSLVLMLLSAALGVAALWVTPREEDPQIIVPLADLFVSFPGHSAHEVEQLVTTPLEKLLYQIDGVEYVYSMSYEDQAVITVRFYVGEDRERSLVKIRKRIDENLDIIPPGVTGWAIKPVEIDDVPIVTLALRSERADSYSLRRVAEEITQRLAAVENVSRAYVVGGEPRVVHVRLDPDRMRAHHVSPLEIERAIAGTNVTRTAGTFTTGDELLKVQTAGRFTSASDLADLVVGVFDGSPVFLKTLAAVVDGPEEIAGHVRHGWGPNRGFAAHHNAAGTLIGAPAAHSGAGSKTHAPQPSGDAAGSSSAVTIAIAKKQGTNAVWVAQDVLAAAETLQRDVIPDDMELVITRNSGLTANEKVNELIEALAVAIFLVIAVLTLGLGWREALIVAVAVPVVFGLTLLVNLLFGFTINRVTLFALILSIGLLVDDPIVDVENISRHFAMRGRATRAIVQEAVAEIRPPLITATLAVIVSFLPMSFITGMMGPYMRPMALNVPVAMIMSMVVAFTITPWLAFHVLKKHYQRGAGGGENEQTVTTAGHGHDDMEAVKQTFLYRLFYPLMAPLLHSRVMAWSFLGVMGLLTVLAAALAATRHVPLKMLPFDNKNELLLVLNFDEGTTLERSDAVVREMEEFVRQIPEVTDYTSYVGLASPMDFNGLVRHYYLRRGENVAEIRLNLVGKKSRADKSHTIGLRVRDQLTALADRHGVQLSIVELPPGPPVIASVVAEVYGRPDHEYAALIDAARTVRARMEREPGVVDVDDTAEARSRKLVFSPDREKAAINGVSVDEIAQTIEIALAGREVGLLQVPGERNGLAVELRLPRPLRSSAASLTHLHVKSRDGRLVALAELGTWQETRVDQTIYHKNLQPVVYVFAETAGRPPADVVVDIQADHEPLAASPSARGDVIGAGWVRQTAPKPIAGRTFFANGSDVAWHLPEAFHVDFAGEGEWKITLDVFRDLGLAFAAAMVGIYILLVGQTRSFVIPVVVMLAIPLTVLGIMPGFWLLNLISGGQVGAYADPIFFTATGMIGMIALAGIVTRDSIILVDFIHLSLKRGRSLFDAIMESRVVRLRPILLTTATAMFSAIPIAIDPIFSGLAWALIFGLLASTVFTLFVIPVTYWLVYANKPGHGLPVEEE